jgi:hypothetical protein
MKLNNLLKSMLDEWYWHDDEDRPKQETDFYGTATRDKSEKNEVGDLVTWKKGDELEIHYSFDTGKYRARIKGGLSLRIIKKDFERDENKPFKVYYT